jgi:hypothetical protein
MEESVPSVCPHLGRLRRKFRVAGFREQQGTRIRLHELGQAEVHDLDLAALGHEDVGRLDVAMDDPEAVCRVERVGDLHRHIETGFHRQGSAVDELPERAGRRASP